VGRICTRSISKLLLSFFLSFFLLLFIFYRDLQQNTLKNKQTNKQTNKNYNNPKKNINNKVAWIILALTVNRYTSFFGRIWWNVDPDEKIHGSMMKLVYIGIAMELCMILYLTVYLPKMKGLKDVAAWNIYCPKIIPTMIILGLITYLLFLRATWGIWGFLTPLISGTQFMGFLMILHFIPSFGLV